MLPRLQHNGGCYLGYKIMEVVTSFFIYSGSGDITEQPFNMTTPFGMRSCKTNNKI